MAGASGKFWTGRRGLAAAFLLLGGFYLWCALTFSPESVSDLRFSKVGALRLNTAVMYFVLAAAALATGGVCFRLADRPSRVHDLGLGLNGFGLFLAVLLWGAMDRRLDVVGVLTQSLRLATPIALGAMAGILCERSGVINIAIEGMMLTSACVGFVAALYGGSMIVGLTAAILSGMIMAALHAVLSVQYKVDQIISGTVINILAVGVTGFLRRSFLIHVDLEAPGVFPLAPVPLLSDIPVIGQIFFRHQPMVYTMMVLVVVLHVMLFHSRWGLRTRTVGEHPRAADTLGVNVFFTRYLNVVLAGGVAGLAGAWFSLETVGHFNDIMTGGKGFIALAAMIFGKWTPFGATAGALLFGAADAIQIKLQISGVAVPYQFLGMAPYFVTMVVLAGIVGRAIPPAAIGQPYERD